MRDASTSTRATPLRSAPREAGWVGRVVFGLGLLAALAIGLWPVLAPEDVRPSDTVLLDQRAPLRSDGTEFAFTVRRPSRVRVWVELPGALRGTVRFGVAAPAGKRAIAYAPLAERELTFRVEGSMPEPFVRDLMAVGTYILRVDRIPTAMGEGAMQVHAYVTAESIIGR